MAGSERSNAGRRRCSRVPAVEPAFVLHPSVPARWWLVDLPNAEESQRFLRDGLDSRRLSVISYEGIAIAVLGLLVADLRDTALDPTIAQLVCDDVVRQFHRLIDNGSLRPVSRFQHAQFAFGLATRHRVTLADALRVALAESAHLPLLVADDDVYRSLKQLEPERPGFQVVLISDYASALAR